MTTKVVELGKLLTQDAEASWVGSLWDQWNRERASKLDQWLELRNYIFATDTKTTANSNLPWQNSTTTPKLCQLRDNLHSNYISALFPNDRWLEWEGNSVESAVLEKAAAIEAYISNKCKMSHFRTTISKLIYDYIDYGNAFATVEYIREVKKSDKEDEEPIPIYVGPRLIRISPMDIVFNPLADDITKTPKIIRSVKTLGEIMKMAETHPDEKGWVEFLKRRIKIAKACGDHKEHDFRKACGYSADGFGDMYSYFQTDYVEILEFFGDYHDPKTGELRQNRWVTIADRNTLVRDIPVPNWGGAPIFHVGWRYRQDNLWAMGPLDNLVGMQYRIDHLENMKADAHDLTVHPPLAIIGNVEEFEWGPGVEIHIDEGGSIQPLSRDLSALIQTNNEIAMLESKMELYCGAPREAMGIRTPGEKTAFEVGQLNTAAGRIFQEKVENFEVELLEPSLNCMLEVSVRNMDNADVLKVMDHDLGFEVFQTITKDNILASGILRPVGARHFSKQQQDIQTFMGFLNSPLSQFLAPHVSGEAVFKMVEDVSNMQSYKLFSKFKAIADQKEQASYTNTAQEQFMNEATTPAIG